MQSMADFARAHLGDVTTVRDHTRSGGRVLAVRDTRDREWIVKHVPGPVAFRNEVRAYRQWVPKFAERAPTLLAADRTSRLLLIERLPGRTGWTFRRSHHREAGRLLATIHGSAPARAQVRPIHHMSQGRVTRILTRLGPLADAIDPATIAGVEASADALAQFKDLPAVPCHGDYAGHNWLCSRGRIRVIDFSEAGWRPAVMDFARLYAGQWWGRPSLPRAFFEGYGRALTDDERAAVRHLMPVFAFAVLGWGLRTGDQTLIERGRHRLSVLSDVGSPVE